MKTYLETTIGKFIFRVDPTCRYTRQGVWIRVEGGQARLGLSDYLQQRSGDIAFIEVKPEGTLLTPDKYLGSIETIKVNADLFSPVSGKVVQVNTDLESTPELINQDPYGEGWLCEIELTNWETDQQRLIDATGYLEIIKSEAEEEIK